MEYTLNNEQLAVLATRTFSKLWMARAAREALQPFQSFCYELLRSTQIAMPIVVLALLYVHKFKQRYPGLHGGNGSEYRMFVVALMLASKYLEDNTFTTQTWSEVSHLPARELAIMQREFLLALDHRLHVPDSEYNAWITRLQKIVSSKDPSAKLNTSPMSAFTPVEVHTPAATDFQVVPPSPQDHAPPVLPSPPAKRMRCAPTYFSNADTNTRMRPEALSIPSYPAAQSQLYTPPSTAFGFAPGDFTFNVPAMPAFGHHNGLFFAHPHSASVSQPSQMYGAGASRFHPPSLATFNGGMPPASSRSYAMASAGYAGAQIHLPQQPMSAFNGLASRSMQQPLALPSTAAAMATASALATHYPGMCYNAASLDACASNPVPIYNYGA
ncbi:hypothetical protein LPJ78_001121 [Coemansia sp. RSA 989]|nr:hypothetical protein BX667DRAFT_513237 [Coemansia mojavensis]KAJ1741922.1 hypothetical protein LPJ68_002409 [Coemansia sp. RSA 1086]KAJ1751135.1 hypothetical protein LPJ79_002337 [Coemansia sp. RSA 1821]KAJ1867316.1 hypothetical protein LPJ78_001121 [Coemansia sp. RSA 989]KAJ1874819.1 hypothetical protein LPJ55_001164 [Coemansia sp. RSA 990]KAJ2672340.1 hypothetical protein IWW42_002890 [Coemansia sp. RSA 1085]